LGGSSAIFWNGKCVNRNNGLALMTRITGFFAVDVTVSAVPGVLACRRIVH
jgi:hypothetical protein